MEQVDVHDAEEDLPRLLARVEGGEAVVLTRGRRPVARLEPVSPTGERELGFVDYAVPAAFFDSLSDDELETWTG